MKNVLIFLLILACVVLTWLWLTKQPDRADTPIEKAAKQTVEIEAKRLKKKADSLGREHAILDETNHIISQAGLNQSTDTVVNSTVDSLTTLLGIERRNFRSYVQAQTKVVDSLMRATKTDKGYEYSDRWVSLSLTTPTATDSAMFAFSYNAEVNYLQYWKRSWILGRKKSYMDIWLSDPRARVNGVKRLIVEPNPKTVSVDLMAVGEYYRDAALFGGGVSVDVGRLRLQGNYLYDPNEKQWYPAFRGGWKLVSF